MSTDKRTVHTDALETLGTLIDSTAHRDAIHLAVEPVIAGEILTPGQHIGIVDGKATSKAPKKLGIVDPFLQGMIMEEESFWLIVYPRTITSLRHIWEHPDFTQEALAASTTTSIAEREISNYAASIGVDTQELIYAAEDYLKYDEYLNKGELLDGVSTSPEFWKNFERLKGISIPKDKKNNFFSCSC